MKVHGMFGEMSDLVARIQAVREGAKALGDGLPEGDALRAQLTALSGKADEIRKKIVATKEGGAITGEERLREHMDQLYGGIAYYEGRPAATLIAYTAVLRHDLDDVAKEFETLREHDLAPVNAALKAKGLQQIDLPEHAPTAWQFNGNPNESAAEEAEEARFER